MAVVCCSQHTLCLVSAPSSVLLTCYAALLTTTAHLLGWQRGLLLRLVRVQLFVLTACKGRKALSQWEVRVPCWQQLPCLTATCAACCGLDGRLSVLSGQMYH